MDAEETVTPTITLDAEYTADGNTSPLMIDTHDSATSFMDGINGESNTMLQTCHIKRNASAPI